MAAAVLSIGTGCAGIAATETVSPLMFFLPGLVKNHPAPAKAPPGTQVASNGNLTLAN